MKGQWFRRSVAMLLTLCMLLGMVPVGYATDSISLEPSQAAVDDVASGDQGLSASTEIGNQESNESVDDPAVVEEIPVEETGDDAVALYNDSTEWVVLRLNEGQGYTMNNITLLLGLSYVLRASCTSLETEVTFSLNNDEAHIFEAGKYMLSYRDISNINSDQSILFEVVLVTPPTNVTVIFSNIPENTAPYLLVDDKEYVSGNVVELSYGTQYSLKLPRLDGYYPYVVYSSSSVAFNLDSEHPDYYIADFSLPSKEDGQLLITYKSVNLTNTITNNKHGTASFGDSSDTTMELPAGETLKLVATPNENCVLYGWKIENQSSGAYELIKVTDDLSGRTDISLDGNTLKTTTGASGVTYTALFENRTAGAEDKFIFKVGTNDYFLASEAGDAVAFAAKDNTDDVVVVIGSGTVTEDFTIPSGVTLLLPYSDDDLSISGDSGTLHANVAHTINNSTLSKAGENVTYCLTIPSDVTITCEAKDDSDSFGGRIVVGGVIGSCDAGKEFTGQTYGAHSEIILDGKIVLEKDAVLSCCGYITTNADGEIQSYGGIIYEPYVILDMFGGSYMAVCYMLNQTIPYNCYAIMNIQCDMEIQEEGQLVTYASVFVNNTVQNLTVSVVGSTGSILDVNSETKTVISYEPTEKTGVFGNQDYVGRNVFNIYYGGKLGYVTLDLGPITLQTYTMSLPFSYNMEIHLRDGEYSTNYHAKLNPGMELYVEEYATFTVNGSLFVYNGTEFLNYSSWSNDIHGAPPNSVLSAYGYPQRGRLVVNGRLIIGDTAKFAGLIESEHTGASIKVSENAVLSMTYREGAFIGQQYQNMGAITAVTTMTKTDLEAQVLDPVTGNIISISPGKTYMSCADYSTELNSYWYYKYDKDKDYTQEPKLTEVTYTTPETVKGGWSTEQTLSLMNGSSVWNTVTGYVGQVISVGTPTPASGYVFAGWATSAGGEVKYTELTKMPGETTLYAIWKAGACDITFDLNGAESGDGTTIQYSDDRVTLWDGASAAKTGYQLTGWKNSTGDTYEIGQDYALSAITAGATKLTLYAVWTPITYSIKFNGNGADNGSMENQSFTYGESQALSANGYTKTGYTFAGWKNADGNNYTDKQFVSNLASAQGAEVTLNAQWTANTYTVIFNPGDGSGEQKSQTFVYDIPQSLLANTFTKEGHKFAGWMDSQGKIYADQAEVQNLTVTKGGYVYLTAQWTTEQYTITFDAAGGSEVDAITQDYGTAVTAPADPTKTGYTFLGWDNTIPATMPAENVTITAKWKINQYTITFDTDGGSTVAEITQDYGTAVTAPAEPTKTGYTFAGWDKEIPATMPAGDLTITAKWIPITYTVEFNGNGADGGSMTDATWTYDQGYTPANGFTRTGYTFAGWKTENGTVYGTSASISNLTANDKDNVTLYAQWTAKECTFTLNANGGTVNSPSVTGTFDQAIGELPEPTRNGYSFTGWYMGETLVDAETKIVVTSGTLTAGWEPVTYTITFTNYYAFPDDAVILRQYTIESNAYTLPVPVRTGYTFGGWTNAAGQTVTVLAAGTTGDQIFTANWTINQYTITFVDTDGSVIYSSEQEYGSTIATPAAPSKTGHTFAGWDKEIPATMPANDVTITAQWTINRYTITFDAAGGSAVAAITQDYGTAITAPENPTKTGYTFNGWSPALPETMPADSKTHTAQWTINQYTITFDTAGGSAVAAITQNYGTAVTAPAAPTKTGYTFLGWDNTIPATMPAGDLTITAQWAENVDVTLNWGYNDQKTTEQTYIGANYSVAATVPSRDGYTFDGWFTEENVQVSVENPLTITGNISLNAHWTEIKNTISYDLDGGTLPDTAPTGYSGAEDVTLVAPTKTGYTFVGWTGSNGEVPKLNVVIEKGSEGNRTYTANWTKNSYTITFDSNGGSAVEAITKEYGEAVTAPADPNKTGHTFAGWYLNGVAYTFTTMPAESITLTANWNINSYKITFDPDGGSDVQERTFAFGDSVSLSEVSTKTGYTFKGWDSVPTTMPAENIVLKAIWEPNTYKLSFNLNYQTTETIDSITQTYDQAYSLAADPTRTGYTFGGWYTTVDCQDGTKVATSDLYQVVGDQMLYAKWTVNTYTVTWNVDGTETKVNYDYGELIERPEKPSKEGYTFASWSGYTDGMTMPDEDLTFTAQWTINTYTVTWDVDGTKTTVNYDYGTLIERPEVPSKEGYTFASWSGYTAGMTMPDKNLTFTAQWTINTHTVTWKVDETTSGKEFLYGNVIVMPVDPEKEGYTFTGWTGYTNGMIMPDRDVEFTATWSVNSYKVTYKDGESILHEETVTYGTQIPAYTPSKVGYSFTEWDAEIPDTMPAKDITLTASWTANSYQLTTNVDGTETTVLVAYGAPLTELANVPGKTGYQFVGWYDRENGHKNGGVLYTTASTMPAGSITLYACWNVNSYKATFVYPEGANIVKEFAFGANITVPIETPVRNGYTFDGWELAQTTMPAKDITVEAKWIVNSYELTFYPNGGILNIDKNPVTYEYGASIVAPEDPTRTGYKFLGWYANGAEFNFATDTMPAGDFALTAKWEIQKYTITFNSMGGSEVNSITAEFGAEIDAPVAPFRVGYTFKGWYTGVNGTGTQYFVEGGSKVYMPVDGIQLYAHWNVLSFYVNLDPTEGGTVSVTSIPVNYGSDADVTAYIPQKAGYLFKGWYLENVQYTTFTMGAEDITLTAKYVSYLDLLYNLAASDIQNNDESLLLARTYYSKLNTEQLTAYNENETYQAHREAFFAAIEVYSEKNLEQSIIEALEPTNKILENHGIEGIDGPIAELNLQDHHLEGVLLEEDCLAMNLLNVNFLEKLFEFEEIVQIQIEDTVVTNINQLDIMLAVAYATLAEEGQTMEEFMNYLMDDEVQYSMTVGDMDQTSAEAIVTGKTVEGVRYSLKYSSFFFNESHTVRWNDGTTVTDQLYDYQTEILSNDAVTKTGYTLTGWKDAAGNMVTFPVSMGKTDVEYFAVWTPNEYTVNLNYGDGRDNGTATVTYGENYGNLPWPEDREGYAFKGWYSEPDGQGTYYNSDVTVQITEAITLYGFWEAGAYTISFDVDGGSAVSPITQQCDTSVSAPADPTKAGYEFAGWYLGDEPYTFTTMPAKNINLTAKWTAKTYTITFMDDDGVTALYIITAKYGEPVTAPADPSRTGYTFLGWDQTIPQTMPIDGMTITARWQTNRYTITYNTMGGTAVDYVTLSYGTEIPLPEETTRTGYTFVRWEPEIPETMPAEDMTITAIWQVNSYTITFDADGGSGVDSVNVDYGAVVSAPADPTRTGYTFMGWKPALPETMPAKDLAVTATWKANEYTVTLEYADGVTADSTITVHYNETYEALPVPTREGYDFVGWFDGETQINTKTVVTILAAQTLTARWNESGDTPYRVEHYQQGLDGEYTLVDTTEHTGITGGTAQVSHQSYTGFHANSEISDASGVITADGKLVLKVYYDRNLYNITWKVRGTVVTESWMYGATPVYTDTAWEDDIHYSYTFTGWDQEIQTVTGEATYTAQYDKAYEASIGAVTYKSLKLAMENAVSGNVVRLDANITLTEDMTVPAGVTLLIPCVDDDAGYNLRDNGKTLFNYDGTSVAGKTGVGPYAKLYKSLTVPEGITLTVKGTMLINSVSGRPGTAGYDHDITGGYGQVNLDGNIVVENGGNLDCFGYIKGEGMVTAKNGAVIGDLYIVRNWRGGTQGLDMYQQKIYPINEYDCHNIQTDLRVEYGASLEGLVKMYANAGSGGEYYYTRFPQIHNTNGLLRLTTEDSYAIRKYVDGVEKFYVYGGADFGSSALSLLGMSLSTAMMTYPTDGDITYDLYDGDYHFIYTENTGNWANGFKFLTGSGLTVHDGASLTVDEGVTLSFYEEFVDGTTDATRYPDRTAAILKIEAGGKFINAGSFGGIIETESPDILIGDYPVWGTVTYESAAFSSSTDTLQELIHDLTIYREGYSWKFGADESIIWIGADYTEVEAALKTVPADLFGYSKETRSTVEAAVAAVVYDLPTTRQADVDAMAKAVSDAVKALQLAVVTVSFDSNGGSAVTTTLSRTFGDAYGTLPETSLEGYEFVGWYTETTGGQLITTDTKVNFDADITLYAKWRDATITEPADYTALNAAVASVPTEVAGYTDGSVAALRDAVSKVEYGLTIDRQSDIDAWTEAIYGAIQGLTPKTLTITFNPGEGRASFLEKTVTYLSAFGDLPTATRQYYSFVGWFTAAEGGTQITADTVMQGTADMTLYARFVQVDGDYTLVNRYVALIEEAGDLSIYSDDSIANINAALDAVVMGLGAEDQDQIDQMAQALRKAWNGKTLRKVFVSFKPNGGTCSPAIKPYRYGDTYSNMPVATREGYTFLGWYTALENGTLVDETVVMNQIVNHNLYAQWKWNGADYTKVSQALARVPADLTPYTTETKNALQKAINAVEYELGTEYQTQVDGWADAINTAIEGLVKKTLTVTFDANGGKVTPSSKTVTYGASAVMPVPTRSGYQFNGWYTAKSGGTQYTDSTVITANVTLYAQWKWSGADYTKVSQALARVPADLTPYTTETKNALQKAINAVEYELGAEYQTQVNGWADAINTAVEGLVKKTLVVTFDANGGKVTPSSKTVTYGASAVMPVPTRSGYRFNGWFTAKSGGTQYTDSTVITVNVTLYARWTLIPADYTEVNEVIAEIPVDLSIYTAESVAALKTAMAAVKQGLSSAEQSTVNGWTAALNSALEGLVQKLPFTDVKEGAWYHDTISELYYAGIVKGMSETTYEPDGVTTRAQMAVLLYRISGEPKVTGKNPFVDISESAYYYDAVRWGYENGIIKGLSDTTFGPDEKITREQFATMLYRLYGEPKLGGSLSNYPDGAAVSEWAREAVIWTVGVGIIKGDDTGRINPNNPATRAEVATMLLRYMKLDK